MNYQIMINGFPLVSIYVKDRLVYYTVFDNYCLSKDLSLFVNLVEGFVEERLDEVLEISFYQDECIYDNENRS